MVKSGFAWSIKLIVLVLIVCVGWLWYRHYNAPEKVIYRRLQEAMEVFSKTGPENPATLAIKMGIFEKLVAENIVCDVPSCPFNGTHSVTTFTSMTFRSRALAAQLRLALGEYECMVESKTSATVRCMVNVAFAAQGRRADDSYSCCVKMTKADGKWRIAEIRSDTLIQK